MGIPYGLVLLAAAAVLATRHATTDQASARSKWAVGGVALASVLTPVSWRIINAIVQLGVCVYVIFYRLVLDELAAPGGGRELPDRRPELHRTGGGTGPEQNA